MRTLLALLACAASACIERPFDAPAAEAPRPAVDRAALRDVLVQSVPEDAQPVGAIFGGAAELVAFRFEPKTLLPGQRARLTLYFRCRAPLEPWHVFVHLDDPDGNRVHAEHDPAGGRFPTDAWKAGDLVADTVAFEAPPRPSPLQLYLGFYSQGETRLPLTSPGRGRDDGNNRLFAGTLPVAR